MNRNRIITDGFSNPDTERGFSSACNNASSAGGAGELEQCGACLYGHFVDDIWVLCLNPGSHYYLETVDVCFGCSRHADRHYEHENE